MRKKQKRFADNAARRNVIQPGKELFDRIKGKWQESYFGNDHPVVVEIGCGRGEYSVGLAREFPEKNFVGVDIKGARLWVGSSLAVRLELTNVAFLRIQIQSLVEYFESDEVDEIWITFPDPRPKDRDEGRRLTNPRFLEMYKRILKQGGMLHVKTDNEQLFQYTLDILSSREDIADLVTTRDLYRSDLVEGHYGILTKYEEQFHSQGFDIKYLRCSVG